MKRNRKGLAALLLAVAMAMFTLMAAPAWAVDLTAGSCSLTVHPGGPDLAEDLAEAQVVLDLYPVATAVEWQGYDAYNLEALPLYSGLTLTGEDIDWEAQAQTAAAIALESDTPVVVGAPVDQPIRNVDPGLYLVLAHGADLEDYVGTVTDEEGNETLVTLAYSGAYEYRYSPALVALPGRADEDAENPGEWVYDEDITLKPEREVRFTSLRIVKTLTGFSGDDTFVFSVEVEGYPEYSDVVYIGFDATTGLRNEVVIDGLPVGADVIITEVYSGASYRLTTAESATVTLTAEEIAEVTFENTPTDGHEGGAIVNEFNYDGNVWVWTPVYR